MLPNSDSNIVHRPSALKQQNKRFKTGRYGSQHGIKRIIKGRVTEKKLARSLKQLNITNRTKSKTKIETIDEAPQFIIVISLLSKIPTECSVRINPYFDFYN